MHKHNDPRFWGRAAGSGAVTTLGDSEKPIKRAIEELNAKLSRGATVGLGPNGGRFISLRQLRRKYIFTLGMKILERSN